jgi:hypothetical protein
MLEHLRSRLAQIKARYDTGAMPEGVWEVVKKIERDIAYLEQQQGCCER